MRLSFDPTPHELFRAPRWSLPNFVASLEALTYTISRCLIAVVTSPRRHRRKIPSS